MSERRRYQRVTLDMPFFCDVTPAHGPGYVVMVLDLCRGGLRMSLPPSGPEPAVGDVLRIGDCPECTEGLFEDVEAAVAWVRDRECGIRFVHPPEIPAATLQRILAMTNMT